MKVAGTSAVARVAPEVSALRLWGLERRWLDTALTLVAVVLLAASRFALLASGPWEWDETIFARGMLDFSLAAHFPHPPGFPGFLALGHVLLPLAGEPYRALQLVSALASVLVLWPLAALGRRVAAPAVAAAAALLVLALPGPWLFSVRGFSTTAAATVLLAGAALLVRGLDGRRATVFTLLVTSGFLIRPVLLPTAGLLWLVGAETVRPRRRLWPGLLLGAAAVAVAVVVMARLEGGWAAFAAPFVDHASFHTDRLHRNTEVVTDLGLLKGAGGVAPAVLLVVAAVLGLEVWRRRAGARAALAWLVILGLTSAQLVMLQNRSYPRYAVGVQMAAAPLIAGAASLAAPPVAVAGLLGLSAWTAVRSLSLVREQHATTFGAWQVTLDAADRATAFGWAAVVEPEVHVFSSYRWSVLDWQGRSTPPMILSPRAPEPWLGVDRPWLVATVHPHLYWPSLTGTRIDRGGVSERLRPLTQDRFLAAAVIDVPPLPVGRWWTVEGGDAVRPFMWAGPRAELWLPPVPAGTLVGLELRPAPGDAPVEVDIDHGGGRVTIDGRAPATRLWTRTSAAATDQPVVVTLRRARGYAPGGGDDRDLAVQLLDVVVRPPGAAWGGPVASGFDRERLRLVVDGHHGPEALGDLGRAVWLEPSARLRLVVDEPGAVTLELAGPRPTPALPRVLVGGVEVAALPELGHRPLRIAVPVGEDELSAGFIELEIVSEPYRPAEAGGDDFRTLGVVLLGLDFEPAEPSPGWWNRAG
jgi:hypothetical protein